MKRKSEARIAATAAAVATSPTLALGVTALGTFGSNDDILGEVPKEIQSLTLRFADLPQKEIV
ncbi:hypothetical protein MMC31_002637, partial [Peltigera leucophlebia]|nr:hypothetical protein [Peltigera leucophlebia]